MEIFKKIFEWLSTIMNWAVNLVIIDDITLGQLVFGLLVIATMYSLLMYFIEKKRG